MRILLITSRRTGRWIIPKGNRMAGLSGYRAAELEAYEEAGLRGVASPVPIGRYRYVKYRADGTARDATVDVFPMAVTAQVADWPEKEQRMFRWFSALEAAQAVEEPDLQAIIAAFREPVGAPGLFRRAMCWLRDKWAGRKP